ncbi:MAG: 30S ribosomal protein S3 [Lentisphaerae bacterium]|nr:30S ribosomal protein S3 [Lentisphaerota bacterium]
MGQKVNPIGFRVTVNKNWRSRWYADKKTFGDYFHEDLKIRDFVKKRLESAAIPEVLIERYANRIRVTLSTARPGIVIGRKGQDLEKFRDELSKMTGKEVYLDIKEVRNPDVNAQLVAENVAVQLERRVSFRRAMKKAIKMAMDLGAFGIKMMVSGRLGGAELARRETYKEGKVPLHTLRAFIDYGYATARTVAGAVGVKVWICRKPDEETTVKGVSRRAANS